LVLNVILFILVGFLFYYHFKGTGNAQTDTIQLTNKDSSLVNKPLKVAYVDLDSIEEKFIYFKQKQTDYDNEREAVDKEMNDKYVSIEKQRAAFAQKGSAITQTDAEEFQKQYTGEMQDLQKEREQKQQEFADEQQRIMADVQGKMHTFLDTYNKTKHYSFIFTTGKGALLLFYQDTTYNITNEVIDGLNAMIKVGAQ
jgi:outer membrane protein